MKKDSILVRYAPLGAVLLFTFYSFFMVPNRVQSLRRRLAAQAPDVWAQVTNNGPFRILYPNKDLGFTDEPTYAGRTRQIVLHGKPYDPWLGKRSLRSWLFDHLMFYPIGAVVWLCGGNFALGWTTAHALVGCGWLLAFFLLFRKYGEDDAWALTLATFFFFFLNTFYEAVVVIYNACEHSGTLVPRLLNLPSTIFLANSTFMRLPSMGMTYLWLAAVLSAALALGRSQKRRPILSLLVGAACGLLCFLHFFEWILGVLTVLILAAARWRDPQAPPNGRLNLTGAAAIAGIISGGYYLFAKHLLADTVRDTIYLSSTAPRFSRLSIPFLLFSLLFAGLAIRRNGDRRALWSVVAAMELAAFIVSNLQLVLGYDMQFDGHAAYCANIAAILGLGFWLIEWEDLRKSLRPHAFVIIAFTCAWTGFKNKSWADSHYKFYGIPQDVADAAAWLNSNAPKGALLLSPSISINWLLPLEADVRLPSTFACTSCGSPIPAEDNLRGLALILKNLDVDAPRFLDERWRMSGDSDRGRAERVEDLTGDLDWKVRENFHWPIFILAMAGWNEGGQARGRATVLKILETMEPLREPFYAWIQNDDMALLRRDPVHLGGRRVYQNRSVSLYEFPAGASLPPTSRSRLRS